MSKVIKVQARDSIIKILGRENGVKGPVVYQWVKKVWELNPHISNPDLIYPGERILLPDQLQEHVPQKFIWENAFSQMPSQLNTMPPLSNQALAYQSEAGDTIDIIAEKMFSSSPNRVMPHGIKRAILLHNNQKLLKYQNIPIPTGIMINLTTYKLSASDIRNWEQIHIRVKIDLDTVDQSVKQAMYHSDMDALYVLSNNLTAITSADGYAAGLNDNVKLSPMRPQPQESSPNYNEIITTMRDPLKTTGYGVAAGSAASASGAQALAILNAALDDVYRDAYRKFGENVLKNPWQHMMKIEQFLTSHPKWNQAMKNLKKTPEFLLSTSQLKPKPNPNAIYPNANTFKNHIVKVSMNPDTPRYTGSLAKKLNGKIKLLNGWSNRLTWGVPLVLGGISIATAPREMRMQVLFEQGFSIVGGALGTYLGTSMITTGAALLSIFGICISPVGIFIAAFIVGGSLGYYLSEMGKNGGGFLYNEYDNFKKQGYYHSMDDFLGDF